MFLTLPVPQASFLGPDTILRQKWQRGALPRTSMQSRWPQVSSAHGKRSPQSQTSNLPLALGWKLWVWAISVLPSVRGEM